MTALAVPGIAILLSQTPAAGQQMQFVGAPNIFDQNGKVNTQLYSNLPNAFNWHPYQPGVAPQVGSGQPPPPTVQIIPPGGQGGPSYPIIQYDTNGYYGNRGYNGYGYNGYNGGGYSVNPYDNVYNGNSYGNTTQPNLPVRPTKPTPPTRTFVPSPPATVVPVNITPPSRPERHHRHEPPPYYSTVTIVDGGTPTLIGGYYYPNYCEDPNGPNVYPSIYSIYGGFPGYIYSPNPGVTVVSDPYYPNYATGYSPFSTPTYQVTYNQNNYYTATPQAAEAIQDGGNQAERAIKSAYAEDTYQAAFADIEQAWISGNLGLIRKHLRDADTKISVLINRKYAYSISSDDFSQITRDAMQKLDTVSFKFTRLRKAKNGDITAYGIHTYVPGTQSDDKADDTVAFDTKSDTGDSSQDSSTTTTSNGDAPSKPADVVSGEHKTMFVSYTLRKDDDGWIIVLVDSSTKKLVPSQSDDDGSAAK